MLFLCAAELLLPFQGYECDPKVMEDALGLASKHGTEIHTTNDPMDAIYRADVIVTDTWVSMGQEETKAKRLKDFAGFQVTQKVNLNMGLKTKVKIRNHKQCCS